MEDKVNHPFHHHPLYQYQLDIQDDTKCKICGLVITGFAHGCDDCEFFIHDDDCIQLEDQIHHKSHPGHPIELHPPSNYNTCDACLSPANTPFYRCSICDYDLHLDCAKLHEMRLDKRLELHYSLPHGGSAQCSVCNAGISKKGWVWYNRDTGYTTHLKCGGIYRVKTFCISPMEYRVKIK